jgi:hypothetical protein
VYYLLSVSYVALVYAARIAHAPYYMVICGRSDSFVYFLHFFNKRHDFIKNVLDTKYVFELFLKRLSETFLILRRIHQAVINVRRSSCKVSVMIFQYIECFKKSFKTLKTYRNLYRGRTQRFELSKCSKTHRVLTRIVIRNCFDLFFRFLLPHYQWKSH